MGYPACVKLTPTNQKLRGGYYTPKSIAEFLSRWAVNDRNATILEPSCGDGVFLHSAYTALRSLGVDDQSARKRIIGVELDADEAKQAVCQLGGAKEITVHACDFFSYCEKQLHSGKRFSAIIGNPPFIRYQNFSEQYREVGFRLMEQVGLHPNRLTNAWVPFLICASRLLDDRARLAMVIPSELFQVNYAAETRKYLSDFFSRITILTFKQLLFGEAQQEVVLLLAERNGKERCGIRTVELNGVEDLLTLDVDAVMHEELKPLDHTTDKWIQYFLTTPEIELLRILRLHPKVLLSGKVIDVDVGVVTGNNDYFILSQGQAQKQGLHKLTTPIVSRSAHLEGLLFDGEDWKEYPNTLFMPPTISVEKLPKAARIYIIEGERKGYSKTYKCRIRKHWYVVPSTWKPEGFMLRQVHNYPKIIVNKAEATSTDTIHRVKFLSNVSPSCIAAAFLNSMTFAFSEITGRSYGGGVMTFEPSEAESMPMCLENAEQLDTERIDRLLRMKQIEAVLDITDEIILRRGMGLPRKDIQKLRQIWLKLRDRRVNRKFVQEPPNQLRHRSDEIGQKKEYVILSQPVL